MDRFGRLGDPLHLKRFGVRLSSMGDIEAGIDYEIVWRSVPGDAERDNGNIWMFLGRRGTPNWEKCRVFYLEWGIDPIPGQDIFHKQEYEDCLSPKQVYVPIVNWLGSFFEEDSQR
ncbi:MAG: hypothetical protein AAF702_14050 [Chloroflexota bacterium]